MFVVEGGVGFWDGRGGPEPRVQPLLVVLQLECYARQENGCGFPGEPAVCVYKN